MDGSFQDLDGESMEVELDEFFREIFKMLKFFQQKQNKAQETSRRKKESPTIILCSAVMEQVKEFKVFYLTKGLINEVL